MSFIDIPARCVGFREHETNRDEVIVTFQTTEGGPSRQAVFNHAFIIGRKQAEEYKIGMIYRLHINLERST